MIPGPLRKTSRDEGFFGRLHLLSGTYIHTHVYTCWSYMYVYRCTCTCMYMYIPILYVRMYIHVHVYLYTHVTVGVHCVSQDGGHYSEYVCGGCQEKVPQTHRHFRGSRRHCPEGTCTCTYVHTMYMYIFYYDATCKSSNVAPSSCNRH